MTDSTGKGHNSPSPSVHPVERIQCSVGVTAYNEEANISQLLAAMRQQRLRRAEIIEIIVVASACTDRTEDIVRQHAEEDPRIKLICQEQREGKTSAINLFLQEATCDICVLESGDTVPHSECVENMVSMFDDPEIGMVGAQKVPVNASDQLIGYLSHLRLKMEHQLCLEIPRLGEMIAFRRVFDAIPADVAMDEAFVEALSIQRGLQVRYAPDAIVYNMGPETLGDFIRQRRRNHAGHLYLRHKYGYRVSSLDSPRVMRIALGEVWEALRIIYVLGVLGGIEMVSRALGTYDFYIKKDKHVVWDMAWTTKHVDTSNVQKSSKGEVR
jgi:poly-beta-1,6-N-acetyl-D-glucosamine synthase